MTDDKAGQIQSELSGHPPFTPSPNFREKAVQEHFDQKVKMIVIRNKSARNSADSLLPSDVCQVPATPVIIACTHPISWSLFGKHLSE